MTMPRNLVKNPHKTHILSEKGGTTLCGSQNMTMPLVQTTQELTRSKSPCPECKKMAKE